MADQALMLDILKQLQGGMGRLEQGQRETVARLGIIEQQMAGLHVQYASLSVRIDSFGERLARIEHRLELAEADGNAL